MAVPALQAIHGSCYTVSICSTGRNAVAVVGAEVHEGLRTEKNHLLLTMVFVPRIINHNLRLVSFELERHLSLHLSFCLRL